MLATWGGVRPPATAKQDNRNPHETKITAGFCMLFAWSPGDLAPRPSSRATAPVTLRARFFVYTYDGASVFESTHAFQDDKRKNMYHQQRCNWFYFGNFTACRGSMHGCPAAGASSIC